MLKTIGLSKCLVAIVRRRAASAGGALVSPVEDAKISKIADRPRVSSALFRPPMNTPNHLTIRDSTLERSQGALSQPIDQSNQAIEQSRAEIARSQAQSQAEADLARHRSDQQRATGVLASPGRISATPPASLQNGSSSRCNGSRNFV